LSNPGVAWGVLNDRFSCFVFLAVNNAGFVLGVERVGDIAESDIEAMFATNVFGLISLTQLLVNRPYPFLLSLASEGG
jgi:NADP-dependent 3-hydroxy acid dehydrogenase YdfG